MPGPKAWYLRGCRANRPAIATAPPPPQRCGCSQSMAFVVFVTMWVVIGIGYCFWTCNKNYREGEDSKKTDGMCVVCAWCARGVHVTCARVQVLQTYCTAPLCDLTQHPTTDQIAPFMPHCPLKYSLQRQRS